MAGKTEYGGSFITELYRSGPFHIDLHSPGAAAAPGSSDGHVDFQFNFRKGPLSVTPHPAPPPGS